MHYPLLADLVLAIHTALVLFVVGGLGYFVVGGLRGWPLARAFWLRSAHLAAIAIVVAQSWLGALCPLTSLEMWLREQARQDTYSVGFIEHWLHTLIYHDLPTWVLTLVYTLFGLAVVAAWWCFPPRWKT